jgi:predicted transcriptional regulator
MPSITVRVSDEEKKRLLKHGALSKSVREALQLYLSVKKSDELIGKLEKLQRSNRVRTTTAEEVRLINEDRRR